MRPKLKTFKNGLRLLTIPQPEALTATALILVGTGSKYESKSINGLSHFLEHMYFKGTKNLPSAKVIAENFDGLGAISNAFTSTEYTGYYAKGAPKNIETFINILSDIYLNSTFPEIEIEKEKGVIIEEINMYEDMPQHKVGQALMTLMYGDQPAGWPIIGSRENVLSFTRKDFLKYKKDHYHADNTLIIISGGVESKSIESIVSKAFKDIPISKSLSKKKTKVKSDGLKLQVIEKKSDQTHLAIGFHSIPYGHPDARAMVLLATILGRGMSSRLFQVLREELGVAYYVGASQDSSTDQGVFEIVAGIDKNRVNEILSKIKDILSDIKINPVPISELNKAREYALGTQRLHLESSDDIAGFFGVQLMMKNSFKTVEEIAKEFKKVTPNDISRLAKKIFQAKNTNIAILGPCTEKDIDLKAFSVL